MALAVAVPGSRRIAGLALAALIVTALAGPATTAAVVVPDDSTITANEAAMVVALNKDRANAGLVPVRTDPRLMAIARARSADMVAKGYFSHTQPDGHNVFDILSAQGVAWYNAGEIIAWNSNSIGTTTATANSQWMNSPGHHAIIVSKTYNYVGVGLAVDPATGHNLWTGVFIKGPDRTGARSTVGSAKLTTGTTSLNRKARIAWTGADVKLQVLTAGFRAFTVQRRVDDGPWTVVWSCTTLTAATFTVYVGHRYEFRISGVDKKSNRGAWVTRVVDLS